MSFQKIKFHKGRLEVPDKVVIPFIEGDGIGKDIWKVARKVFDEAVKKAYNGQKEVEWLEIYAGEKSFRKSKNWLPEESLSKIKEHVVAIKGPLTTPIGEGFRSLNVTIRQELDLYVCQRPVRYFNKVPSPVKSPEHVDMVIFRENTEDIYAGIEFDSGEKEVKKVLSFLKETFPDRYKKIRFPESSSLGLKPVSKEGSFRLIEAAIEFAIKEKRPSVTLVHKGNIMKSTEGSFRNWGYELAETKYPDQTYTWGQWEKTKKEKGEEAANKEQEKALKEGKVLIKDAIADIALQQVLTRPKTFSVIATLNLNGDYLSDALAAQVGGIGIAPGGNINYQTGCAVFEATHGTAPKYEGLDKVNPGSVILSGEMMFRYMGWKEVCDKITKGLSGAISSKKVTYDFARLMTMEGEKEVQEVKCSQFGDNIISHMS